MSSLEATVPDVMMAARLHTIGEKLRIDRIPVPEVRPTDVLVEVKRCGVVANLRRVMDNYFGTKTADPKLFPPLPAIFGLDPTGVIAKLGDQVTGLRVGQRVYVNPARGCGSCRLCRTGRMLDCPSFSYQGYFARSRKIAIDYPFGGFAQYLTAPGSAIVTLADNLSFEHAARLGYLGTAYSAMKKIGVGPGETVLINGISGTLGLCAAVLAVAMGAGKVLGVARNPDLLERVRQISPGRIFVFSSDREARPEQASLQEWSRELTDGYGVDGIIDCLPPGAPPEAMLDALGTLRRGGRLINVGAVNENVPLNAFWMMTNRITVQGSTWFTTAEAEELTSLLASGLVDLSVFTHHVWPLRQVNEGLDDIANNKSGGFANHVIDVSNAD